VWAATNLPKQAVLNIAQYILDRASLRWREPNGVKQVGVLPYKLIDGRVVFLLVTSRRTGRWIVPKGSLIKGESRWRSAEIEAIEEAGVEGIIEREPIGTYRTIKKGSVTRQVVEVDLYPLLVTKQHDTWPEQTNRHRHWVLLREGKRLVSDPNLPRLMTEWSRRVLADN
jgi:ADP-ribose pyrophosphatase YjhB (NUDIX family)